MTRMMDFNFFKDKSVFITGHTGFKGAWLSFWLTLLGARVTGFAHEPESKHSLFDALHLKDKLNHIVGDVRDVSHVQTAMHDAAPEFVFHLAAQALVRKSYASPIETFSTNVMGSTNVLEAVRHTPSVRSLVYITSDKCYWNHEWIFGYRENDRLGGPDPYSASKACAELCFTSFYESYFKERTQFGCGSTRAGNVIGGGDRSKDRIIPDIIRALEQNEPVVLRSPEATRPWQHVLDPLSGYLTLALQLYHEPALFTGEAWNFGPKEQAIRDVQTLTERMIDHWGNGKVLIEKTTGMHEAHLLYLSIDKATRLLHWKPKLGFENAVKLTCDWYKAAKDAAAIPSVTRDQIMEYTLRL